MTRHKELNIMKGSSNKDDSKMTGSQSGRRREEKRAELKRSRGKFIRRNARAIEREIMRKPE